MKSLKPACFVAFPLIVSGCILGENDNDANTVKDIYVYAGKISALDFVKNEDDAKRCFSIKVERYTSVGGTQQGGGRLDTLIGNSCDQSFLYTRVLDTLSEAAQKHFITGTFVRQWQTPKLDSNWVKDLELNGDVNRNIYSKEFLQNRINIYATFDYYGSIEEFKVPAYFDSVSYTITLKKIDG